MREMASFSTLEPAARFVLHAPAAMTAALSDAFGVALPGAMNRAAGTPAARAALRLGPDEWLLIAAGEESTAIERKLDDLTSSLVDVSDRQVGFHLEGTGAALALNAGVPLDLSLAAFPVAMATRTIFEKAEIVLWRTAPDTFRIEAARSFASYVRALITIALRENTVVP